MKIHIVWCKKNAYCMVQEKSILYGTRKIHIIQGKSILYGTRTGLDKGVNVYVPWQLVSLLTSGLHLDFLQIGSGQVYEKKELKS
jgi:hypothetical protein